MSGGKLFEPYSRGGIVHLLVIPSVPPEQPSPPPQSRASLCGHVRLLHPDDNHTPASTFPSCLRCLRLAAGFWTEGDAPYDWHAHGGV